MQADNAPSVERQLSMLLSLTAKLLHVVILQSHLIYLWLRIIQKALMLTPPPHSNTDTPEMVTCLPADAVRAGECLSFCCCRNAGASFFRGTHLVTDLKPLAPPTECTVVAVSSALSRRSKKIAKKNSKKQCL